MLILGQDDMKSQMIIKINIIELPSPSINLTITKRYSKSDLHLMFMDIL